MSRLKRSFIYFLVTLAMVLTGVFLFGQKAGAQSDDSKVLSPLRQNEPVLEVQTKLVVHKTTELRQTAQEIQDIADKKQALASEIDQLKVGLDTIQQKIADKKAAAEAERKRVEELKNLFVNVTRHAAGSAGNTYALGNCTWYVKSRRADIPNNLGNANTWYSRARAQNWNVGLTPKKGAIATTTAGWAGHVAYVEGVSLDAQWVTISEMNYRGLYSMNTRTVHYTAFTYIYELE